MHDKGYRILVAVVLFCTLAAALAVIFLLPDRIRLSGTGSPKSSARLLLITILPLLPVFLFSQKGSGKGICVLTTLLIELYALLIILDNTGIFHPDPARASHIVLSILIAAEAVHLGTTKNRKSKAAINFKWIDSYDSWLDIQRKGSRVAAVLAAVEMLNTMFFLAGLYGFKESAITTAVASYAAVLVLFRLAKPDQNKES